MLDTSKGKGPLGRAMQRQDNIKLDLKEIPSKAVGWIQVA
jgi:hypothetical protein